MKTNRNNIQINRTNKRVQQKCQENISATRTPFFTPLI